jgi:hypothetical protein
MAWDMMGISDGHFNRSDGRGKIFFVKDRCLLQRFCDWMESILCSARPEVSQADAAAIQQYSKVLARPRRERAMTDAVQFSVLIRLPDTLRRTDSLEGRKAGKMCRKRSFSAFLPSKSALCQATGYAGNSQNAARPFPLTALTTAGGSGG